MSLRDDFSAPAKKAEEQSKATIRAMEKAAKAAEQALQKEARATAKALRENEAAQRRAEAQTKAHLGSLHQTTLGLSASLGGALASGLRGGALGVAGLGAAV